MDGLVSHGCLHAEWWGRCEQSRQVTSGAWSGWAGRDQRSMPRSCCGCVQTWRVQSWLTAAQLPWTGGVPQGAHHGSHGGAGDGVCGRGAGRALCVRPHRWPGRRHRAPVRTSAAPPPITQCCAVMGPTAKLFPGWHAYHGLCPGSKAYQQDVQSRSLAP